MLRSGLFTLLIAAFLGACSGDQGNPLPEAPTRAPEPSEVILQAVDAGTGAALSDDEVTVRHLVRFPITLDASRVDRVSSSEPYSIRHPVAWDSLVVEVRLEASSYHRLDTVLTVSRGASVGPVTLRMARRLDRAGRVTQPQTRPGGAAPTQPSPSPAQPADPDAGIDRGPLSAGDQAFRREAWAAATQAYFNMPVPPRRTGTYAREYARAKVRQGTSHINLGEWGGALDDLEEASSYPDAGYSAYLLLGQAQCTVGRFQEGRQSVERIAGMATRIPGSERAAAHALAAYQGANCSHQEFMRAEAPMDLLQTGGTAITEYEAFIQVGEPLSSASPEVAAALADARAKIEQTRTRMRGGGGF